MAVAEKEGQRENKGEAIVEQDSVYDHWGAPGEGRSAEYTTGDITEDACRLAIAGEGELDDSGERVQTSGQQSGQEEGLDKGCISFERRCGHL